MANTWLKRALFSGISVVSYNVIEEPGQVEELKEILLVQFEFNL